MNASGKSRERLLICCTLLFPLAAATFAIFLMPSSPKGSVSSRLTEVIIIGSFVVAQIEIVRLGRRRAKRQLLFVLRDNEIVRKRDGWPDDRIAFSDIAGLYDGRGGLVVESVEPFRRISIPKEANGFGMICAELAKHHPFSDEAKPPRTNLSATSVVVWIITILSWAALIFIFYKVI